MSQDATKAVEDIISKILIAVGERPSVEESAKAQTLLLAEILRELSALKAEVRLLGDDDDDDRDDDRDDDDDDDDRRDRRSSSRRD
ncbi:MAG: hypothetical protein AB7F94_11895 [Nitrospira sp.]